MGSMLYFPIQFGSNMRTRRNQKTTPSTRCKKLNHAPGLHDISLEGSSVFECQNSSEVPEKSKSRGQDELIRPMAFRPHFSMGLALGQICNDFGGLPQAIFPRGALEGEFEAFQLHGDLRDRWSENWVAHCFLSYHNSVLGKKNFRRVPGGDFIGADAEVWLLLALFCEKTEWPIQG
jgi:hypothetical protein